MHDCIVLFTLRKTYPGGKHSAMKTIASQSRTSDYTYMQCTSDQVVEPSKTSSPILLLASSPILFLIVCSKLLYSNTKGGGWEREKRGKKFLHIHHLLTSDDTPINTFGQPDGASLGVVSYESLRNRSLLRMASRYPSVLYGWCRSDTCTRGKRESLDPRRIDLSLFNKLRSDWSK